MAPTFTGQKRHMVLGFVEQRPRLADLVEDDRIYDAIADLLGPDLVWITSDGNYYVGDTQWHPDAGGMLPSYHLIKVALYLDPVRADSGCLRVIPGSHREPFHSALKALHQHRADGRLTRGNHGVSHPSSQAVGPRVCHGQIAQAREPPRRSGDRPQGVARSSWLWRSSINRWRFGSCVSGS